VLIKPISIVVNARIAIHIISLARVTTKAVNGTCAGIVGNLIMILRKLPLVAYIIWTKYKNTWIA